MALREWRGWWPLWWFASCALVVVALREMRARRSPEYWRGHTNKYDCEVAHGTA